jgi:hypothetical protein
MRGFRIARRSQELSDDRGQALVEFALALPILLLLMTGVFEFGNYFYTRVSIRHSVLEATRFAVTGRQLEDPDDEGEYLTRAESIVQVIENKASAVHVDLRSVTLTPSDGGGPGDVVRIEVRYNYAFSLPFVRNFFPPDALGFSVRTAMKNEPRF